MKTTATIKAERSSRAPGRRALPTGKGRVHPVLIYPFKQPGHYGDLGALYQMVARLGSEAGRYARPITVMDRKTHYSKAGDRKFLGFREGTVAKYSEIVDAWCVDTCQMWNTGLGKAFEQGHPDDVYWLIPGDFDYGTSVGQEVLNRLHDLPEIVLELDQDLCIGEISTDHSNPKQLIDTYGTFALLYTWFPDEAEEIRQFTERPRSEFFAVRHSFLQEVLSKRWYPYEQTVVMLLHAVASKKRISRFFVGNISDLPEGRESLASAIQQVERTERVLKSVWRETNQSKKDWLDRYRALEVQSEQVRRAALVVLGNLMT
ncbi:MAG: hypothetical protein ACREIC_18925 [Limisphaerales bacterium]